MRSDRKPNHLICGFSLIELLVVVAIVALLIAILTPVLSSARNIAYIMSCSSNMKSITQATFTYSANTSRRLPQMYARGDMDEQPKLFHNDYLRWASTGSPTGTIGALPILEHSWADTLVYQGFIDGTKPFVCPVDNQELPTLHPSTHVPPVSHRLSYGINKFLYAANAGSWGGNIRVHRNQQGDGYDGWNLNYNGGVEEVLIGSIDRRQWAGPKLSEIRDPSRTILFGERDHNSTGVGVGYWHDWAELDMDRHQGDFPLAWFDGSVRIGGWEKTWGGTYRPGVPIWEHARLDYDFVRNGGNVYRWNSRRHTDTALGGEMAYETLFASQSVALPYWQGWIRQPFNSRDFNDRYGGW